MHSVNRRDALEVMTVLVGGALVASSGLLTACVRERREGAGAGRPMVLSVEDQALFEEIADTLLPTTAASPGAKAAEVGAGGNLLLTDCYERGVQQRVVDGLQEFRATCRKRFGKELAALGARERDQLLREIDAEARRVGETHYFGLVREIAERAYFSSEVGMTKALRYVQTPGRWEGCVALEPGQPAWG